MPRPSLRELSNVVTNEYLDMIMLSVKVVDSGYDATIRDINLVNWLRAKIQMGDEQLRFLIKTGARPGIVVEEDPDKDCA
jgi:hypothetical protein